METSVPFSAPIKSALFVDFDNIYIGLSKTDPQAAERFASDPARWLAWLEKGLPVRGNGKVAGPVSRSVLIRRCYPNPDAGFRRFRSFFTSAAFSVIDCPTLTRTGKNSSDIYMVMDILDTLNHKTHFDEFIIFSGDSDFMPVLLRLRAYDRRTTTLAIDFMPPAFKAACDLVISEEEFIEDALGVNHDNCASTTMRGQVPAPVLKEMAQRVYDVVCSEDEVPGADLPDILKDFREFRDSNNWLGFGTSQRLAEALACSEPRLDVIRLTSTTYKIVQKRQESLSVPLPSRPVPAPEKVAAGAVPSGRSNGSPTDPVVPERAAVISETRAPRSETLMMRSQIVDVVREMVSNARSALLLARVSQYVVNRLGPRVLETQWAGAGSFKRLLQSTSNLGLEITTQPEPGYIFDPRKHVPPSPNRGREKGEEERPLNRVPSDRLLPADGEDSGYDEDREAAPEETSINEPFAARASFEPAPEGSFLAETMPETYDEEEEDESSYDESLPSLEEFLIRVSRVTGAPDLTPRQYALVFRGIVIELQAIARGEKIYNTYQSSKSISDWCAERGEQIPRGDVVLILKGIIYQDGVRFGRRPDSYSERDLACVVRDNIKALCRRSRLELSEYEHRLLDEWILGGLEEDAELAVEDPELPGNLDSDEENRD